MELNKPDTIFRICFAAVFGLQIACVNTNVSENGTGNSSPKKDESAIEKVWKELTKANFPSPNEADFEQEKVEAKKLVASGIKFKNTLSAHGMPTNKGVQFGTSEFETSDGVKIIRHGQLYDSPEEVGKQFDSALNGASKVFQKETLSSDKRIFIGADSGGAFIVHTSGHYLYRVSCPSLRHLLAFRQAESHYF